MFSNACMKRNDLQPQSSLQKSLMLLQKKGVLDKESGGYFIEDVFFKEWIRRKGM